MLDIVERIPSLLFNVRLHTGEIPGPYQWAANLFPAGDEALIEMACGDMGCRTVGHAQEFERVLSNILKAMGFRRVTWVRWSPSGWRKREFTL